MYMACVNVCVRVLRVMCECMLYTGGWACVHVLCVMCECVRVLKHDDVLCSHEGENKERSIGTSRASNGNISPEIT